MILGKKIVDNHNIVKKKFENLAELNQKNLKYIYFYGNYLR